MYPVAIFSLTWKSSLPHFWNKYVSSLAYFFIPGKKTSSNFSALLIYLHLPFIPVPSSLYNLFCCHGSLCVPISINYSGGYTNSLLTAYSVFSVISPPVNIPPYIVKFLTGNSVLLLAASSRHVIHM